MSKTPCSLTKWFYHSLLQAQPYLARANTGKIRGNYWGDTYLFRFTDTDCIGMIMCTAQKC